MPLEEQHFVGFDPRASYPFEVGCPHRPLCWTVVWYEAWHFWSGSAPGPPKIGCEFTNAYAGFDEIGNLIWPFPDCGLPTRSISANVTAPPFPLPTPDEYLQYVRDRLVQLTGFPIIPGGTTELSPYAISKIGTRDQISTEPTQVRPLR